MFAFHENPNVYTLNSHLLTLKAHITKSCILCRLILEASKTNSVDLDQTSPVGAV